MYILGGIDDQVLALVWSRLNSGGIALVSSYSVYRELFSFLINPITSNEPITWFFVSTLSRLLGIGFFNYYNIFVLCLNFIVAFLILRRSRFCFPLAMIFTFSGYLWSHLGIHISLIHTWLVLLGYYLFWKYSDRSIKHAFLLGLFLWFSAAVSNYIGFVNILLFFTYNIGYLLALVLVKWDLKKSKIIIRNVFVTSLTAASIFLLTYLPFVIANYNRTDVGVSNPKDLTRPVEDFVTFSARPWYFFTPSYKNPVYSRFASNLVDKFSTTEYFLLDDYFHGEHAQLFFGYSFMLISLISILLTYRKGGTEERFWTVLSVINALIILFLMLPPFFTVSGIKFFTPGYLLYKVFPMFRVTSRLVIALQVIMIFFIAKFSWLSKQQTLSKKINWAIYFVLWLALLETYIPIKIIKEPDIHPIYMEIASDTDIESIIAVYPYNKTKEALYELPVYNRKLINPPSYVTGIFDSSIFTNNLHTFEGRLEARNLGVDYIVVFPFGDSGESCESFGESSTIVELIRKRTDACIYKILK
ncbi:MAG: hypothetical protein UU64_C0001G0076 [candidate division WWE3 bacterium GW2011_GWF2_41_45]|uniref:Glycosyltransferase RgtA/B/C/D-like domain-containing protein n=3 Tax=Katanobacteria TaxID=422282 RepID=A0A1F4W3T0_UNCKA|nr:MAG: hypothetical protein UU55_C0002G0013 [candidate division WWE3 bacterium GW2011_GWC2_41_23]KKS10807.1 MAG: hypothetical protein UU64_C0001G0076 [candidate division WWE3 bacterium GW2011_GWF2_41_45]KKS12483.1 MAG: hypothetical protein UU68_C0001G0075 [candidate division WWE3 bacterium GW2011_GWF1_41_53]KKS20138.1 MAG: hypothetical protein UU79_C0003G0011 [candidate division WWE3 bacterium GW2011_GWE1_41_72]KKS28496.1 MAG: hypothetical protein UU86_C0001G0016 [candidate division WWE3 bacte